MLVNIYALKISKFDVEVSVKQEVVSIVIAVDDVLRVNVGHHFSGLLKPPQSVGA